MAGNQVVTRPAAVAPEAIAKMDEAITQALAVTDLEGRMQRTFAVADAMRQLREQLDQPGVLDTIMTLQGSRIGFRTDRDDRGGYSKEIVRDCMIEALFRGLYPVGNEVNIIGRNMYTTKEGLEALIRRRGPQIGLRDVRCVLSLPRVAEGKGAVVEAALTWLFKGQRGEQTILLPIRVNEGMGADAVLGKAKRKALAWLWGFVTGSEPPEGDVDGAAEPVLPAAPTQSRIESGGLFQLEDGQSDSAAGAAPESATSQAPADTATGKSPAAPAAAEKPFYRATLEELDAEILRVLHANDLTTDDAEAWAMKRHTRPMVELSVACKRNICQDAGSWVLVLKKMRADAAKAASAGKVG